MDFLELSAKRYSVRQFKDEAIRKDDLEKILEAGRLAPTGKNNQPQKIYVATSNEARAKIKSVCRCTFDAPCIIVMCYDKNLTWKNPFYSEFHSGEIDSSIVLTHMMMEACELGVGSCWVGYFNPLDIQRVLNLPDNIMPMSLMPMGYPADDAKPLESMHNSSKRIDELVEEI